MQSRIECNVTFSISFHEEIVLAKKGGDQPKSNLTNSLIYYRVSKTMLKFLHKSFVTLLCLSILYCGKIQPRMKINLGVNKYPINILSFVPMSEGLCQLEVEQIYAVI